MGVADRAVVLKEIIPHVCVLKGERSSTLGSFCLVSQQEARLPPGSCLHSFQTCDPNELLRNFWEFSHKVQSFFFFFMTQKPTEIKVKARMAETFYSLNRRLCLAPEETEQYGGEIADTANYLKPVKGQENNQPVRTLSRSRQVKVNWQHDGGGIHILPKTRLYQFEVISCSHAGIRHGIISRSKLICSLRGIARYK